MTTTISLVVLLLAAYCYSAPIGTEVEFPTMHSELHVAERDSMIMTSSGEETTIDPKFHMKRTVERDDDSHSDEATTMISKRSATLTEDDIRGTGRLHEREVEEVTREADRLHEREVEEVTGETGRFDEREDNEVTRETGRFDEREVEEVTRETERLHEREVEEVTGEAERLHEREVEEFTRETDRLHEREVEEFTRETERLHEREVKEVTGEAEQAEEEVKRNVEIDTLATVESSTEFNNRALRFVNGEKVIVKIEPVPEVTSSFESLAQTTGLLKTREMKESEESREEEHTTIKSNH